MMFSFEVAPRPGDAAVDLRATSDVAAAPVQAPPGAVIGDRAPAHTSHGHSHGGHVHAPHPGLTHPDTP